MISTQVTWCGGLTEARRQLLTSTDVQWNLDMIDSDSALDNKFDVFVCTNV